MAALLTGCFGGKAAAEDGALSHAAEGALEACVAKLQGRGASPEAVAAFAANFRALAGSPAAGAGVVPEASIEPVAGLPRLADLGAAAAASKAEVAALLGQAVVIKLNGGLGTSMGLQKAKSLLPVKAGKTFLDLMAEQVKTLRREYGAPVRFVLMNSFSTDADSLAALAKKHPDLAREEDLVLMQGMSPKIGLEDLRPVEYPADPSLEWCPPGHGDIYPSLLGSGLLDRLLAAGVRYAFVSNSDNLGATMDLSILRHFAAEGHAFMMEVCERTEADKKGGHLARRKRDGKLILRESAMCADADKEAFQDVGLHRFFNTNNLWLDLRQLKDKMAAARGVLKLPVIRNKKTVNPRDPATAKVYQLETAMGSAIENFEASAAIVVPRARFSPVKTCNDLFTLRSDAYELTPDSRIVLAAAKAPLVKLDDKHYKLVDQMEALVGAYPSLKACGSLTVEGPVKFGTGLLTGTSFAGDNKVTNADPAAPKALPVKKYEDATVVL